MPTADPEWRSAFGIVGELILLWTAVDYQMNLVLIEVLNLSPSTMLEPVVATLDPARKIEMLKGWHRHMKKGEWKDAMGSYLNQLDKVGRARNTVCHSQMIKRGNNFVFSTAAAAKLMGRLNLAQKRAEHVPLAQIEKRIPMAEECLANGQNLIANFPQLHAERARRYRAATAD